VVRQHRNRRTTPANKASFIQRFLFRAGNGAAEHPALHIRSILGDPLAIKRIGLQAHDSKRGSKAAEQGTSRGGQKRGRKSKVV
jgi:hypothetical protein